MRAEIGQLRVSDIQFAPQSANPQELVTGWAGFNVTAATAPIKQVMERLAILRATVATLSGIRARVMEFLHGFVSRIYYELLFSSQQENIFDHFRSLVDARLADRCGDVLQKFPSVYDRLSKSDQEAVSQALNTCRRIIDAFADSILPPTEATRQVGDRVVGLGPQQHQNRILAFIQDNCNSKSRRSRLRHSLVDLYDRISTGVHQDVSAAEARSLFFHTYLLLGEILLLQTEQHDLQSGEASKAEL